jgi:hypothetical protein
MVCSESCADFDVIQETRVYEIRPRKDKRGANRISDALCGGSRRPLRRSVYSFPILCDWISHAAKYLGPSPSSFRISQQEPD